MFIPKHKWWNAFLSVGEDPRVLKAISDLMTILGPSETAPLKDADFFRAFEEPLKLLLDGQPSIKISVLEQEQSKTWRELVSGRIFQLAVTSQLLFLKADQMAYVLEKDNPLQKHLGVAGNNSKLEKVVVFKLRHRFYLTFFYLSSKKIHTEIKNLIFSFLTNLEKFDSFQAQHFDRDILQNKLDEEQKALKIKLLSAERILRRRAYEIDNILEISTELYSILELPQLMNSALLILVGQIGCEKAFALVRPSAGGSYSERFSKGFGEEKIDFEMDWKNPLVDYLIKRKQPVFTSDLYEMPRMQPFVEYFKKSNIQILAPLVYSERLMGIVGCGSKIFGSAFDDHDLQLFSILANIISVSVSNAQMYENVRKMSLTDAMTDLNNYRSFKERLKEEINRANRQKSSVSLIMLDIDNFKNYNDTLGHQAGDEALRQLGQILRQVSRDEDIVNRYGGEEFTVILPGLPKDSIHVLAERIRSQVEKEEFYEQHVQPQKRLTISLGGACLPDDAENFDALVRCADEAMYKSKQNGRNCFTLYQ